jgi:hypothetical protein
MARYTDAELATAKQRLAQAEDRDHRANNPDKGRAAIERLRLDVIAIEHALRWQATATPEQLAQADLDETLNGLYPTASTIARWAGAKYTQIEAARLFPKELADIARHLEAR